MNPCMVNIQVPALLSCVCMAAGGISAGHRFDECSSISSDNPAQLLKDWMESPVQLIGGSSLPNCANKAAAVNESKAGLTCWWPSPRRRREALNIHACHSPHAERVSLASSPFHAQTQTYTHSPFNLFPFVLDGFCGSAKKKKEKEKSKKKAIILYFSTAEIWRIRGGPCSPFSASRTFCYQPISNTHLSPLWFSVCLYALHLSSAQFLLCLVSLPPPASVLILIPSTDPSLLPFFLLSPASCYLSSLSNLPVVSSPPTLPNLSASLPPSFCLHILCGRTSSFCSSLSPFFLLRLSFTVSPSFLLCPFPPHPPAHSISVLSSVLLFLAPSLQGDWQESLALPQATCLCAPHSSIHLPLHFLKNVLWMAAIRKTREGRLPGELRCRFGEQDSSVVPKMCHYGNLC